MGALMLAGCTATTKTPGTATTPLASNTATPAPTNEVAISTQVAPAPSALQTTVPVTMAAYTNKAAGYTVQKPEKWYWRHYVRSELGSKAPLEDDLVVMHPQPLGEIDPDYLGQMSIAVSRRAISSQASPMAAPVSTASTVGGVEATRYEWVDLEKGGDMKVIEYRLMSPKKQALYIRYNKINTTPEDEKIFEDMVKSFTFEAGK